MDFNKFTEKLQEAVRAAQTKALRYGNQQIEVEHLIASLLEQDGGLAPSILHKADLNVENLKARLDQEIQKIVPTMTERVDWAIRRWWRSP